MDVPDGQVFYRAAGGKFGGYAWSTTLHMKSAVMRARLWQLMQKTRPHLET
jgi:hypothetical protein